MKDLAVNGNKYKGLRNASLKVMASIMFANGIEQKVIAKELDVTDRTIRTWLKEMENIAKNDPTFRDRIIAGMGCFHKSMNVILKYLNGDGEKSGGDLTVALEFARMFGVLPSKSGADRSAGGGGDTFIAQITAINSDIRIAPKEEPEFAKEIPEQLKKMFERMGRNTQRSEIARIPESTGDTEVSG